MSKYRAAIGTAAIVLILAIGAIIGPAGNAAGPPTVALGASAIFAVLAGSGVTNTGATTITGDVGSFPTRTISGPTPPTVIGRTNPDPDTKNAKTALASAYDDARLRTGGTVVTGGILGAGATLPPGLYNSGAPILNLTGVLTLDAQSDPTSVWIFQATSSLGTAVSSEVRLINGARACNVFWQVTSSATIETDTIFKGTIMAAASITVGARATISGRALAMGATVTLDTNSVTACDSPPVVVAPANVSAVTGPGATSCAAVVTALGTATATDNSGAALTPVRSGLPPSDIYPVGTPTTITYTATDGAGNIGTAPQVVTVTDNTVPTISAPADATYQLVSSVLALDAALATAADNCGTATPGVAEIRTGAGSAADPLIITRTFTSTDSAGNISGADVQTITVADTIPPVITAPTPLSFATGPGALSCSATVGDAALGAAVSDNGPSPLTLTHDPAGNVFNVGSTTLTYDATDAVGNAALPVAQVVNVTDNTVPTISSVPADSSYQLPVDVPTLNAALATAADNCGATPAVVEARSGAGTPASPLIITRTFTATDAAGNASAPISQTITVMDTTPAPTPTPTPSVSPSTPTPSASPSATPSASPASSPTSTASPSTPTANATDAPPGPISTAVPEAAAASTGLAATRETLPNTSTVDGPVTDPLLALLAALGGFLVHRSRRFSPMTS